MGNILTTDAQFTIAIDENFENDWVDAEEWLESGGNCAERTCL